jgi:prophage regulatory protein
LDEKPTFISMKDTCRQLSLSRTAIELRIAAGTFPAKVYFGDGKRFAFVRAEIDEWVETRIAERDARAA